MRKPKKPASARKRLGSRVAERTKATSKHRVKARAAAGQTAGGNRALAFSDKLLADQAPQTELYRGDRLSFFPKLYEMIVRASGIGTPYEELDLTLTDKFTVEQMGSNPITLRFLQMLIRMSGARRALELGSFIGVSSIYIAKALPAGGKLVTIEKGEEFGRICDENFRRNDVSDRIELKVGDADVIIDSLPRGASFDFIFIDADKGHYADYMRRLEPLLAPGGLMVVDDALFHGDVLNDEAGTSKGKGVQEALELAKTWTRYRRLLLPLANGMLILQKPAA